MKTFGPNDQVHALAAYHNYCCPFALYERYKHLSHKKLSIKLKIGLSTVQFNRRKIRNGTMAWEACEACQHKPPK